MSVSGKTADLLVSRAELARLTAVSRAAITKACRSQLADACVGKKVDLAHESARAYCLRRGISDAELATWLPSTKRSAPPGFRRFAEQVLAKLAGETPPLSASAEPIEVACQAFRAWLAVNKT